MCYHSCLVRAPVDAQLVTDYTILYYTILDYTILYYTMLCYAML